MSKSSIWTRRVKYAKSVELFNPNEQVSIWEWDDDEQVVVDSWVVKEYSK